MNQKPIEAAESFVDMPFPVNGKDVSDAFDEQHPGTTASAMNVRTFEALTFRARGGSRAGLSKYISTRVDGAAHVIQHLQVIVDPQADALSANFDLTPPPDAFFITDISTNVLGGMFGAAYDRNHNRSFREGGNGYQHNRHVPATFAKIYPIINWDNPADIFLGTALSATQLNATASAPGSGSPVAGSFAYSPTTGFIPPIGDAQPLTTTFTPTDTATYNVQHKTVHINVLAVTSPTFIKSEIGGGDPFSPTATIAYSGGVSMGDVLIAAVAIHSTVTGNTAPVTDSQGNPWNVIQTDAQSYASGARELVATLWYAIAGATGPNTVSVTPSIATDPELTEFGVVIAEYAGVTNFDNSVKNKGLGGASFDGGSLGVSQANSLGIAFITDIQGNVSAKPTNFFTRRNVAFPYNFSDCIDFDAGQTLNWSGTPGATNAWIALGASFIYIPPP